MKRWLLIPSALVVALAFGFAAPVGQAQDIAKADEERGKLMKALGDGMKDFKKVATGGTLCEATSEFVVPQPLRPEAHPARCSGR